MRSDTIKKGFERAPHRSLLWATGQIQSQEDFDKPFIAICNSFTQIVPGHVHLNELGQVGLTGHVARRNNRVLRAGAGVHQIGFIEQMTIQATSDRVLCQHVAGLAQTG